MAHKTLVSGTAYEIKGGRTLVGGTGYAIGNGKTIVGGTAYCISFGVTWAKFSCNVRTEYVEITPSSMESTVEHSGTSGITGSYSNGYNFSSLTGYSSTGQVSVSVADTVGMYLVSTTVVSQVISVTKVSDIKYIVTLKRVAECDYKVYYSKGSTSYGEITADEDSLPEEGTLRAGSIGGAYCVINVNGTNYYYEKVA